MENSASLHVAMIESGGWGGIGHYTYNLCQALAQTDFRVTLISGKPYELEDFPRGFHLEASIGADIPYCHKLYTVAESLRANPPDLVHIQSTFSARRDWLALILLKILKFPVVFTAHNLLPHDAKERNAPGMRLAYELIYALSDRIIVHSETIRNELYRQFKPSPDSVAVIPHGDYAFVDTGERMGPSEAKRWLGLSPGDRLVLALGAIREYKGIPDLISAIQRVAREAPDTFLCIVGKPLGVDPDTFRAQIRSLGLDERVLFKPEYVPVKDIGRYFRAADIAAFPYRAIAQSGALQLAYAFAKPVVVTRVGALPETVQDGENGLIVPPSDPDALADSLIRLLNLDPDRLSQMGRRSRELADVEYSWDDIARKTEKLYTELLAGTG